MLDKGQKDQYYDYSKIVRNAGAFVPHRKLLIIYNRYDVPSGDTGDIFTVNSYELEREEFTWTPPDEMIKDLEK